MHPAERIERALAGVITSEDFSSYGVRYLFARLSYGKWDFVSGYSNPDVAAPFFLELPGKVAPALQQATEDIESVLPRLDIETCSLELLTDRSRLARKAAPPVALDTAFVDLMSDCVEFWSAYKADMPHLKDEGRAEIVVDTRCPRLDGSAFVAVRPTQTWRSYSDDCRPYFPRAVREAVKSAFATWTTENREWLSPFTDMAFNVKFVRSARHQEGRA